MSTTSFSSECIFYDTIHYPHDFSRAGIFTKREAEILNKCGYIIKQLALGNIKPDNDDQKHMLGVIKGMTEAETDVEKAWLKYQSAINKGIVKGNSLPVIESDVDITEQSEW
jgi:uncharacterized protein YifE (UPF0438 family)